MFRPACHSEFQRLVLGEESAFVSNDSSFPPSTLGPVTAATASAHRALRALPTLQTAGTVQQSTTAIHSALSRTLPAPSPQILPSGSAYSCTQYCRFRFPQDFAT